MILIGAEKLCVKQFCPLVANVMRLSSCEIQVLLQVSGLGHYFDGLHDLTRNICFFLQENCEYS